MADCLYKYSDWLYGAKSRFKIWNGYNDIPNSTCRIGNRGWRMTILGLPTGGFFGDQEVVYNDEYVVTEIGQIETHFDGLGHICVVSSKGLFFYWVADSWGAEAVGPGFGGENPQPFECHLKMQTKRGIWTLENLDLSQLVADKTYDFLFVWSPLKIKGATGSPGNSMALY